MKDRIEKIKKNISMLEQAKNASDEMEVSKEFIKDILSDLVFNIGVLKGHLSNVQDDFKPVNTCSIWRNKAIKLHNKSSADTEFLNQALEEHMIYFNRLAYLGENPKRSWKNLFGLLGN